MKPTLLDRFRESMVMNHERWHDGTGYDLDLLQTATPEELGEVEDLLATKSMDDWRNVEALAFLNTPRTRKLLRQRFEDGDIEMKTTLISYAPDLFSEDERIDVLVEALQSGPEESLTKAMLIVESFHPPRIVKALLDGLRTRDTTTAEEFAMMLLVIHNKAESLYDIPVRRALPPFEGPEREKHGQEFCRVLELP